MKKRICITFAGAVGSSKTPISNHLSVKLLLPVFNNDAVRSEVIEDLGFFDSKEHIRRRNQKLKEIIESKSSFIIDASIDRQWKELKEKIIANNCDVFIISLDLSKKLLTKLYKAKGYTESLKRINELIKDHDNFLKEYSSDISLHISDKDFKKRNELSYKAVMKYLVANKFYTKSKKKAVKRKK